MTSARYPVVVVDIETTSVERDRAQILELAMFVRSAETLHTISFRCKPTCAIDDGAAEVHGIRAEHVAHEHPFAVHAASVRDVLSRAAVIVGFGVTFDLEIINNELERNGLPMISYAAIPVVDVRVLWSTFEPRTLQDAFARFVGGTFDGAHGAMADASATLRTLDAAMYTFGVTGMAWPDVAKLGDPDPRRKSWCGPTDHLVWKDGAIVLNFGKHDGLDLYTAGREARGFLAWVVNPQRDFPRHVKRLMTAAMKAAKNKPPTDRATFYTWARSEFPEP